MKIVSFQEVILKLQTFWGEKGCVLLQPYDKEMGAGTFHPATVLKALGPDAWHAAFVQPSRRPQDGRYGDNPNRVFKHHQFQVILKPSPRDVQDLALESFKVLGLDPAQHDFRFIEDDWASPTLGAAGLGWEVRCDGMEVLQFTYFQQIGGIKCNPITVELTYGLERLSLILQNKDSVYDLAWNDPKSPVPLTYGDVCHTSEKQFSAFHFENASVDILKRHFDEACLEGERLLKSHLPLPAYEYCLKASHLFNMLDARNALSVAGRAAYILKVRTLAHNCFKTSLDSLKEGQ